MVTGNSIDNLTSYHPQRWASKSVPNSRVKNITAETAALGEAKSFSQSHSASEICFIQGCVLPWSSPTGCNFPKRRVSSRHSGLQPSARTPDEPGPWRGQARWIKQHWVTAELSGFVYQTTATAKDRKARRAGFPKCPGTERGSRNSSLCHGEHRRQPAPLARSNVHNQVHVSAQHPRNPFSQLLHISSNWKPLACPASIQEQNTN